MSPVDKEFDTIKASLIAHIAELGNDGEYTIDVLMIAKYLKELVTIPSMSLSG